jgi:hypothetical protein
MPGHAQYTLYAQGKLSDREGLVQLPAWYQPDAFHYFIELTNQYLACAFNLF